MRLRSIGALAALMVGAGFAAAEPREFGSLSIFEKWKQRGCAKCCTACEPGCVPVQPIPAPQLFRAEVAQPKYVEGKQLPPIELVRGVPPPVELVAGRPPQIELVRGTPPPVELVRGMPPPVELFRRRPEMPTEAPPICIPSVTIFRLEPPPCPACPPPVCACGPQCAH
jgi:hypothetical protein